MIRILTITNVRWNTKKACTQQTKFHYIGNLKTNCMLGECSEEEAAIRIPGMA